MYTPLSPITPTAYYGAPVLVARPSMSSAPLYGMHYGASAPRHQVVGHQHQAVTLPLPMPSAMGVYPPAGCHMMALQHQSPLFPSPATPMSQAPISHAVSLGLPLLSTSAHTRSPGPSQLTPGGLAMCQSSGCGPLPSPLDCGQVQPPMAPMALQQQPVASSQPSSQLAPMTADQSLNGHSPLGPTVANGGPIQVRDIAVRYYRAPLRCSPDEQERKLFIGGLSHDTDDRALNDFYARWGRVVDCIVIRDPHTKASRGFGFVTFAQAEMADAALADRPHTINGKTVDPKKAIPREEMPGHCDELPALGYTHRPSAYDSQKVYVRGLPVGRSTQKDYYLVEELRTHFSQFGCVQQVECSLNPRRLPYVIMDSAQAVDRALLYGQNTGGHNIAGKLVNLYKACEFAHEIERWATEAACAVGDPGDEHHPEDIQPGHVEDKLVAGDNGQSSDGAGSNGNTNNQSTPPSSLTPATASPH